MLLHPVSAIVMGSENCITDRRKLESRSNCHLASARPWAKSSRKNLSPILQSYSTLSLECTASIGAGNGQFVGIFDAALLKCGRVVRDETNELNWSQIQKHEAVFPLFVSAHVKFAFGQLAQGADKAPERCLNKRPAREMRSRKRHV